MIIPAVGTNMARIAKNVIRKQQEKERRESQRRNLKKKGLGIIITWYYNIWIL